MSWRLTKQLMPCETILATFAFILSFSAVSISATFAIESTRTREPKILILSVSMAVLAMSTRAFSMRLGCPTPIFLLRMKPSSRYESCGHGDRSTTVSLGHGAGGSAQQGGRAQGPSQRCKKGTGPLSVRRTGRSWLKRSPALGQSDVMVDRTGKEVNSFEVIIPIAAAPRTCDQRQPATRGGKRNRVGKAAQQGGRTRKSATRATARRTFREPPERLMICICSRFSVLLMRITASTASCANWSFSCVSSLELSAARVRGSGRQNRARKTRGTKHGSRPRALTRARNIHQVLAEGNRVGPVVEARGLEGGARNGGGAAPAVNDHHRMDPQLDQLLGLAQELAREHRHGGRAIANL